VLPILPFLAWLAAITSGVFLARLWSLGEIRPRELAAALGCFLIAGYCQFLGGSAIVSAAGLAIQTVLAIYLTVRWRLA